MILKLKDRILESPGMFEFIRSGIDSRKEILDIVRNRLDVREDDRILDIGCGSGYFSKVAGGDYVGIDMSEPYIRFAARRYGSDRKRFMIMDAKNLRFEDKYFDKSLFLSMLHHFSNEENEKVLKEAARVTRKYLMIMDLLPAKRMPANFLCKMDRGKYIRPKEEQLRLVEEHFKVENCREFGNLFFECSLLLCSPLK